MDADLAYAAPSGVATELRLLYCALVEDALTALAGAGYQHSGTAPVARQREAHEAFEWFTTDRTDYPTAFVVIAEALDLDVEAVRDEVRRRWETMNMGEPITKTFTCRECGGPFDHHYPKGYGKTPSYCPGCKDKPVTARKVAPAKPATALVPRAAKVTPLPAARDGGGQRQATRPAAKATVPLERQAATLLADLTRERDELDVVIGYLSRRFAVADEARAGDVAPTERRMIEHYEVRSQHDVRNSAASILGKMNVAASGQHGGGGVDGDTPRCASASQRADELDAADSEPGQNRPATNLSRRAA